ncbi:OadG family protein [uncultured Desulfuromonas sp.]|uniref:OadG family protein n=1 Tax=uncultured Desulfuromonas sp. TaxID=181013 RepID=UPI002AAB4DB1|nr:OadG family protein [uncultured Desulfuromonas sp.]
MIHFDLTNVLRGDGFTTTIIGMTIVFSGLLLISLFIRLLPKILAALDHFTAPQQARAVDVPADTVPSEEEVHAAICLAIHMELERCGGDLQRITIAQRPAPGSFWNSAGKMRSLSDRSPHA